jgi:hypothetical protein
MNIVFQILYQQEGIVGYTTRPGGKIADFWPDDDDGTMFFLSGGDYSMAELLEKINERWPDATLESIEIRSEHMHTESIYYKLYDAGNYTDFIILTRKPRIW